MTYQLGVVGSNWISEQFIAAAQENCQFNLAAVYSRSVDHGEKITKKFGRGQVYTDFTKFLASNISVVYIASPNSLHFIQTKTALLKHKHVICEKPAFSNPQELNEIRRILKDNPDLFFFEAQRNLYDPNFQVIKDLLNEFGPIWGANLNFIRQSSRYPALKAGELPNAFSTVYSGGALADLGVYLVAFAVGLFGEPEKVNYQAEKWPVKDGADIFGVGSLTYSDLLVALAIGKNVTSENNNEIYGENGTLIIDSVANLSKIKLRYPSGEIQDISLHNSGNPLSFEAKSFYWILAKQNHQKMLEQFEQTAIVNRTLKLMRDQAGIIFTSDQVSKAL